MTFIPRLYSDLLCRRHCLQWYNASQGLPFSSLNSPFLQILSPVTFLSLSNGLISLFLSCTCTEVSGVENIGQCGKFILGAL